MNELKDFFSVLQLLKRFGIFIYTGDRKTDIELMVSEVTELFDNGLILKEDYLRAQLILKKEINQRY
ncbi:YqgQ family protein [Sporosarcina highlanderae]|uniref:YqgQ family protein n=1 Tax=Sporosarcina highlanderae TaxID=3035916 RepID=A0ABT8JV42_9BACL|nr:YqgQ family protein [Sporosarcina highlanderae]MDN4609035.1 YqgQ family protein [Sporosarcina highlanderae]